MDQRRLAELRGELAELRERQARAVAVAVAELTEFARSEWAPRELRAVQRRIDRGETSWEQVVLGPGEALRQLLGERLAGWPEVSRRVQVP